MKIIYVSLKYDYMKPERGFDYGHYNFYNSLVNMNGGSNEVIYFPVDEMIQKNSRNKVNEKLLKIADEEKPDLIIFGVFEDIIKKETIKALSQAKKTITLAWMSDDQWAFETYSKRWAPYFNWVVTTDEKALVKYKKIGYQNVIKSQWAYNHWLYKPLNLPKIYEVSFVGRPHGNRRKIIKKIKEAGIDVQCWGLGWPKGFVSFEEVIRIFSQSKICLNFTKNSGILWKELACLFLRRRMHDRMILINSPKRIIDSIKSFSDCMWNNQIKGRNFEIPGCGSFCLTEYAGEIENYYKIGEEIVCFNGVKDLIKKIKYYLDHNEEREAVAKAGYNRTLKDHTYEKRFNEIFGIIGLVK